MRVRAREQSMTMIGCLWYVLWRLRRRLPCPQQPREPARQQRPPDRVSRGGALALLYVFQKSNRCSSRVPSSIPNLAHSPRVGHAPAWTDICSSAVPLLSAALPRAPPESPNSGLAHLHTYITPPHTVAERVRQTLPRRPRPTDAAIRARLSLSLSLSHIFLVVPRNAAPSSPHLSLLAL